MSKLLTKQSVSRKRPVGRSVTPKAALGLVVFAVVVGCGGSHGSSDTSQADAGGGVTASAGGSGGSGARTPSGSGGTGTEASGGADSQSPTGVWQKVDVELPSFAGLTDISGASPDDIWAVGDEGQAWHWDGNEWKRSDTSTAVNLTAVWAAGSGQAWVAGKDETLIVYDNDKWSPAPKPALEVSQLWGSGNQNVWITACCSHVQHWDGQGWSDALKVSNDLPAGVHGTDPNNVWLLLGDATGSSLRRKEPAGTDWVHMAGFSEQPTALWVVDSNNVLAVGHKRTLVHWNGSEATPLDVPSDAMPGGSRVAFTDVWAGSPTDVWVVAGSGTVAHWDGGEWVGGKTPIRPEAIWGNDEDVWVVGSGGIARYKR